MRLVYDARHRAAKFCKPRLLGVLSYAAAAPAATIYTEPRSVEESLFKIKRRRSSLVSLAREVELVTAEPGRQQLPEEGAAASWSSSSSMSLGSKSFPARRGGAGGERGDGAGGSRDDGKKEPRFDRCFSGLELRTGSGPLKDMDAGRLKVQIVKWARAVVSYARQLSFGSPRSRPASSPTTAKSGLGEAREEPPT